MVLPYGEHAQELVVVEADVQGVPPLWIESVLGATYDNHTDNLAALGVGCRHVTFDETTVRGLFSLIVRPETRGYTPPTVKAVGETIVNVADVTASSPFGLSMVGLTQYRPVKQLRRKSTAVIVVGETLNDFALYFNLSRMGPQRVLAVACLA